MASEAPPDFDKPWSLSDVILNTANSGGKDIYAYKGALAIFSPYFRALFFGDFKEKNENSVNVDCDHEVMLNILRNIHQIDFEYAVGQKPYSSEMIVKMYTIADKFDFAFIRKLCLDQMEGYASVEMAKAAGALGLLDLRMKILMKMEPADVNKFLHLPNYEYRLNKEEFHILFKKLVGQPLPKAMESFSGNVLNLEEITVDLENPRVDLTKSWPGADLVIITNNARGRVLFANKVVVETMCPNLHEYLCTTDELLLEGPKRFVARIDEAYVTIKEILSIFHVCNTDFRKERVLHPVLLFDMYFAARNDRLDVPLVRDWCVAKLIKHRSVDAVDVLAELRCFENMREAMEMLSTAQLHNWICRRNNHLCYYYGNIGVRITPHSAERVIDQNLTCWLMQKFKDQFFPGNMA